MKLINPTIELSWKKALKNEFNKPYFLALKEFLIEESKTNIVYPKGSDIFNAFNRTPFYKVKIVLIGQDPYHGENQAHGLSFSVKKGVKLPPSLKNIFKEINAELGIEFSKAGNLTSWADQGVLLLNATLTVRKNQAGSHQKKGWEDFTDKVIETLSAEREGIVFLLWGNFAKSKAGLIDSSKHHILSAAHPSPFSAYNGFFGCNHFLKTNAILKSQGLKEIDWSVH